MPTPFSIDLDPVRLAAADHVLVIVTQPSGVQTEFVCTASPCVVMLDARQGQHPAAVEYLSASGEMIGPPDQLLIPQRPLSSGETIGPPSQLLIPKPPISRVQPVY
jgi:hypothetical protein